MVGYSVVNCSSVPATIEIPREYNACSDFIDRHIEQGRGSNIAIVDGNGVYSYQSLSERINRAGNLLRSMGVEQEARIMLCLVDSVDCVALFWGAVKIGAVPIPINTMLTSADYDFMLRDSRSRFLFLSAALADRFDPILTGQTALRDTIIVDDGIAGDGFRRSLGAASDQLSAAPTTADDVAFWLYTSGSTGAPKGALHLHQNLLHTAVHYGVGILNIGPSDCVFSAAKLFFAYGLGNSMTFPFYVGASAVLLAERPTPQSVGALLAKHQPTLFFAVPTLYAAMLATADLTRDSIAARMRLCISAGEPLPEDTAKRWQERFGMTPLDGIGSTEMLHIFLSNRRAAQRLGTTGKAVPGYHLRLVGEDDKAVSVGEIGELLVRGESAATGYWNRRAKSLNTFQGHWTRTGDKYSIDEDGFYRYSGRTDDMLKVSGQWVSPFDVEFALIEHESVLEAGVVGHADEHGLLKPKAFVVLAPQINGSDELVSELQQFVKTRLAPFKYPRWIEFVADLPKTATGKIQRFKLRD